MIFIKQSRDIRNQAGINTCTLVCTFFFFFFFLKPIKRIDLVEDVGYRIIGVRESETGIVNAEELKGKKEKK